MTTANKTYGDVSFPSCPDILTIGDDITIAVGGADGGSTVVTASFEGTIEAVTEKAVKVLAKGTRYGAWWPKACLKGWSHHGFCDASQNYYKASLRLPRGFKANANQAFQLSRTEVRA